MKTAFAIVLALHGAIHLLGFAKAFGVARVPQIAASISRPLGVLWLVAALAFLACAVMVFARPDRFWIVASVAVVASQLAILTAWRDARIGTGVNVLTLVPIALALLDLRATSFRSTYEREVARVLSRSAPAAVVTDDDLAPLPDLVRTYLRRTGAVGRPRVRDFRARWRGEMKTSPTSPWMEIRAEQVEVFDEMTRLFYVRGSRFGVPFEGLHVYAGAAATMRIRAASLVDVADARGPEMNRSETVTLFNDMCLLAPGSLIGAGVEWRSIDARRVGATFTNAGNTIRAELVFDEAGDLADFLSNDRDLSADGKTYRNLPWSTPVRDYRWYGPIRVASKGDAIWHAPEGDFAYARFELEDIELNVAATPAGDLRVSAADALRSGPGLAAGAP